jgi:hypothetical protein
MPRTPNVLGIKDKVLLVFQNKAGETFGREEIVSLVVNVFPGTNRGSILPPNYCYNSVNRDTTSFSVHLFESLRDGTFKCLGPSYPYSGPIYWEGEEVGNWDQGKYQLWKDPRK